MTDEQKAKELANYFAGETDYKESAAYSAAIEMAKWKDEQFDEEKKDLLGLVNMLPVDDHNQTIIEDLKALLQ